MHVCGLCVHQVEEQEEAVVKVQADLSVYRATHTHPDTDYDHQLRRGQDLEEVGVNGLPSRKQSVTATELPSAIMESTE